MTNNNPTSISLLTKLLDEIDKFLSDEGNLSNFSSARSQALLLVGKIKTQSKLLAHMKELPEGGESYVDMKGQPTAANMYVQFETPKDEIYSDIPESINVDDTRNSKEVCPYQNVKYSDFTNCRKKGVLNKREKLLFFDTNRKYYGLIYENYFLLYLNETDAQAAYALNLQEFQGRAVDENPKSFFLINKVTKAPYIFFAVSYKDKLQWLAAINHKKITPPNTQFNRFSTTSILTSLSNTSNLKKRANKEPEEIYEMLEEEDYDRVDNSQLILSGVVKVGSTMCLQVVGGKPLPKLPSPSVRAKATPPLPTAIPYSTSSGPDDDDDNKESTTKKVLSEAYEEDHYDIVCTPRVATIRQVLPIKARTSNLASVHPSVVSDLNRIFNKQTEIPSLMKTDSSANPEIVKNNRCSNEEYYESIVNETSGTYQDAEPPEEDIYDNVVNILIPAQKMFHPQTIDELKSRLRKSQPTPEIKPRIDDLKKPIIKPEVKLEKTKSYRRKFSFFKEAPPTKII